VISGSRVHVLAQLEADGLVRRVGNHYRTTRRWQGAMARAAMRLAQQGEELVDLRVPMAHALIDIYGHDVPDEALGNLLASIAPIELVELGPPPSRRA
jgi:hypothetical protein